ncbi:MAG: SNF2 helicase associated domain-containing protein [Clostridia bacterium]|nr:SNF2 helicase associated domain-containing protein [Clostridia bacterium]
MFTLMQARSAIANPGFFARGSADVQEKRVSGVTVREDGALLRYSGTVRGVERSYQATFEYDEEAEAFVSCRCDCSAFAAGGRSCRHVAALMIAVCGGAGAGQRAQEGGSFIDTLLHESRSHAAARRRTAEDEPPVRLYPILRREDTQHIMLGLKLGRTRPYVVRSMAEFAVRAAKREQVVYGRELTTAHREEEIAKEDVPLFGLIAMLAADKEKAVGGELRLGGAALDQTMRLLAGREIEVRTGQDTSIHAKVMAGEIQLPLEVESANGRAQLNVFAEATVLGSAGAYQLAGEEIRCAFGAAFERIAGLLQVAAAYPQGVRFDEAQLPAVCTQLIVPAKELAVVRKGREIVASHTPTPATPRLYVDKPSENRLTCRVAFDYCGMEVAPGETVPHIRRDTMLEEDVIAAVRAVFPETVREDEFAFEGGEEARFSLLSEQLPGLERAGEVMISERLAQGHVTRRRAMSFGLSREGEKLVLKADLGGFTQEDLNAALLAYRHKRRYVRLSSDTFLSGEALEQAAEAAQVLDTMDVSAEQAQEGAEVAPSRALYLEEALKNRENIRLRSKKDVGDWVERLRTAQSTQVEQPKTLQATLRSYQLSGLAWMSALSDAGFCGILADDMGLGKTIQALALLLREREMGRAVRALVICPASLQLNWQSEARRFAPSLTCRALLGSAQERHAAIQAEAAPDILIASYDQLRRDVQAYAGIEFTHVLLDEAQNIKNAASLQTKAVKTLRAQHRFAMTGTPIENRLSELWSIFDFLMPGYLYTYKKFKERFEAPVVREADEQARENLHLMVAPFILRRMKKDVLSDLPEKVETVMTSEMTAEQSKLYAAHAAQLLGESEGGISGGQEKIRMLAGLTRLRQLCCDPRLCLENYRGGSGKLVQLLEVVRDALSGGHRILLFSQFTSMLELIAQALDDEGIGYLTLTGETDKEERMELVGRFNDGDADVFLISLKAGGTGLNLTGADVVIHYDPWWNVAAQNQATDRAYRIGQTKGVQVIRLIAAGTVEERIVKMQEGKQMLSDGVLLGEENLFTLDADVLHDLLRG